MNQNHDQGRAIRVISLIFYKEERKNKQKERKVPHFENNLTKILLFRPVTYRSEALTPIILLQILVSHVRHRGAKAF